MAKPFELLQPGMGSGEPVPPRWRQMTGRPMIVIVGGMATGKTTTVDALRALGFPFRLLPNRRDLTSQLIVGPILQADGQPVRVLRRFERLPYIKRYQRRYPAGLAYAITQLWIDPAIYNCLSVFDGLRGEAEVRFAVEAFPLVRFVVLTTPNLERLMRLISRRDSYDYFSMNPDDVAFLDVPEDFAGLGVPAASALFSPAQERLLLNLARNGKVNAAELADKLSLICAERSLYDLQATTAALLELAPERTIVIDTQRYEPESVAQQALEFLRANPYQTRPL